MTKAIRWSVDELDAFRRRQHREDMRHPRPEPPVAGIANEADIPTLPVEDAVAGPGAVVAECVELATKDMLSRTVKPKRKPKRTRRPEERPYYQALCALLPPGIPPPVPEYRFDPRRLWRLDFAWPDRQIGLEVDGALFVNGAHNRGAALLKQYEKANAAAIAGWTILRYGTTHAQLVQAARDVAEMFGK